MRGGCSAPPDIEIVCSCYLWDVVWAASSAVLPDPANTVDSALILLTKSRAAAR